MTHSRRAATARPEVPVAAAAFLGHESLLGSVILIASIGRDASSNPPVSAVGSSLGIHFLQAGSETR
jgi:hypothetical protein